VRALAAALAALLLACADATTDALRQERAATGAPESPADARPAAPAAPAESPPEPPSVAVGADGTFLQANVLGPDGRPGYLHVTQADMPWRVSLGYPKRPPKYASRKVARQRAIAAIQMWETAIQPHLPWFRLAFVEDDPHVPVQVEWKRRIPGPFGGFGRMTWSGEGESLRVGGEMQVSTTPDEFTLLEIDDIDVLLTHEFGHVLGLGHCHDCDSAMNYSWSTRGRVFVTALDVRTFLALVAQPNAY
jgi:hypothetical protein